MSSGSSTAVYEYRIYCQTEGTYVSTWSTTEPTSCPNNNTHTIDQDQTSIINSVTDSTNLGQFTKDDNRLMVAPSLIPVNYNMQFLCIGDNFDAGVRGGGTTTRLTLTNLNPGVNTFTIRFVDLTMVVGGSVRVYGGNENDYLTINVMAPATPVTPNATNTGNCNLQVTNKGTIIVPSNPANTGTHDVDLDEPVNAFLGGPNPTLVTKATPVPASDGYGKSNGHWQWNDMDGSILPVLDGTGGYNLYTQTLMINRWMSRWSVWMPDGMLYDHEFLINNRGSKLLPHWQLSFQCTWDAATHAPTDEVIYQIGLYLARKIPA